MRIALALLAAVGSALIGRSIAQGCLRRAAALRQAMDAMQLLRIQMLERLLPLHAALEKSGFEPFRLAGTLLAGGESGASAWKKAAAKLTKRGAQLDCLTADDLSALSSLFDGLGMSARAEQEVLFASALREVGRLESEAQKSGAEKGKLYTTLGLLCGLMLAIAFI